jgi:nucleotidyltransferase/DNA polymerase involved in DNA repair
MQKSAVKDKKAIRVKLNDSLHETIKNLGISKSGKKFEKILQKTSRKLAAEVAIRLKKESKKMHKAGTKLKKSKHVNHEESVAA